MGPLYYSRSSCNIILPTFTVCDQLFLILTGVVSPYSGERVMNQRDYYSTFHKTGKRKRFTKQEWEDFTRDSTREAVGELAASPEFTDWIIEHADRIKLIPSESSEDAVGSESGSTDDNVVASSSSSRFRFLSW